ncbi:MAG: class I SAM-dependent methyltransferase [Actinomycetota bacterium]|nr:class I SAM-dependent methyltransferase [Actinomycetota bacterium]
MDERVALNRRLWDEMARLHTRQKRAAPADRHVLRHFERDEIGDLSGLRVCHLQCHIGEDSIALAQLGPAVVGVDCSEGAISTARQLAHEHGVADRCRFVAASVEDAPTALGRSFDVVYASWGVLVWLPELAAWAAAIETLLVPGGFLYLAESHPYAEATRWSDWHYGGARAHFDDSQGDYTDDAAVFEHPQSWEWSHGLGEVVTALAPRPLAITRRESEGR